MEMEAKSKVFLTDTHAHLASPGFSDDLPEVIHRARNRGVQRIVTISCDAEDSEINLRIAKQHPIVLPTVGIHPLYISGITGDAWLHELRSLASHPGVVAIGEIGLDYFHPPRDGSPLGDWRRKQRDVFEQLLQLALDLDLPAVIHQRESAIDVAEVLSGFPGVRAVLHCFSGNREDAARAIEAGHFLSFTGIITFKNSNDLRSTAATIPLDRIMVETDCPYLAPDPFRGKRCEPSMLEHTAKALGDLHGLCLEEISAITSANAARFFRFEMPS